MIADEPSSSDQPTLPQRIAQIASALLSGELGTIEASRSLCGLRFAVSSDGFDPDFIPFVGIDSMTDHLPLGEVRRHWAPDALVVQDAEIRECEAFYRERALAGARRLLKRFGPPSSKPHAA